MINFESGNTPTSPLLNKFVTELVRLRNMYDYPKAYLKETKVNNYDVQLAPNLFGKYIQPENNEVTDYYLDSYHYNLLRSNNNDERLLGLSSVVYWGYYTFGHNYACVRVDRLVNGYKQYSRTTIESAAVRLNNIIQQVEIGCMGTALNGLAGISQLNRTPFASKVIAFVSPSTAGVYDNRINNGLKLEPWAIQFKNGIGHVNSVGVQKSYQSWCSFLTLIASQINLGIASGKNWCWSCGQDSGIQWRALDVERALFAKYGKLNS